MTTRPHTEAIKVFIENEAGSREKKTFDERTLKHLRTQPVSAAYPFAYGFVMDTVGGDGDAIDCFVLSGDPLQSGAIVSCNALALLEKIEDGETDHKVIAAPVGEARALAPADEATLREFLVQVFAHVPGKTTSVGSLLHKEAAVAFVQRHRRQAED